VVDRLRRVASAVWRRIGGTRAGRRVAPAVGRLARRLRPVVVDDLVGWATHNGIPVIDLSATRTRERAVPVALDRARPDFARAATATIPGRFLLAIPGGVLWGRNGLVVLPDGTIAAQSIYGRIRLDLDRDSDRPLPKRPRWIAGDVCTLLGEFSNAANYWHWTHDGLLRLHRLADHLPAGTTFVVPADLPRWKRDSLRLLGIGDDRLLRFGPGDAWACERLWFPSLPSPEVTDPDAGAWFRRTMLDAAGVGATTTERRLFLSRDDTLHGRIVDEERLVPVLERHGFERVRLTGMPVVEQVRLFASAGAVVGPTGAAFTNLMFSDPTTRVVEIVEPTWSAVTTLWSGLEVYGQPYAYLEGETVANPDQPDRADLSVDPDLLDRALTEWLTPS